MVKILRTGKDLLHLVITLEFKMNYLITYNVNIDLMMSIASYLA